jgi:hypothetical protein
MAARTPQSHKVLFFITNTRGPGNVRLCGKEKRSNGNNVCEDRIHPAP